MNSNIVKRANSAFNQGNYQAAKTLYEQAAERFGKRFFDANLMLCEKRLQAGGATKSLLIGKENKQTNTALAQQLMETQQLLEHYYTRCHALEYRLQDDH